MSRLLMNENEKWNKFIETPLYTKVGKVHSVQEQFFVAKVKRRSEMFASLENITSYVK